MIVVDTSALMEVILDQPMADACIAVLERADDAAISAGTLAEALMVAGRRGLGRTMSTLIRDLGAEIVPVTEASRPPGIRRLSAGGERVSTRPD